MAERASEVTELKRSLAQALRDKEQLQEVKRETCPYFNIVAPQRVLAVYNKP